MYPNQGYNMGGQNYIFFWIHLLNLTQGYPPNTGGYPPNTGGYPPNTGGYPPNTGGYPPQKGGKFYK